MFLYTNKCKVCARWIPRLNTADLECSNMRIASQLLDMFKNVDQKRMNEIVIGDETSVCFVSQRVRKKYQWKIEGPKLRVKLVPRIGSCMRYFWKPGNFGCSWIRRQCYWRFLPRFRFFQKMSSPFIYQRARNQASSWQRTFPQISRIFLP